MNKLKNIKGIDCSCRHVCGRGGELCFQVQLTPNRLVECDNKTHLSKYLETVFPESPVQVECGPLIVHILCISENTIPLFHPSVICWKHPCDDYLITRITQIRCSGNGERVFEKCSFLFLWNGKSNILNDARNHRPLIWFLSTTDKEHHDCFAALVKENYP